MMWGLLQAAINLKQCVITSLFFQEDCNCIFLLLTEGLVKGARQGHLSIKAQVPINICGFNLLTILSLRLCLYCSLYLKIMLFHLCVQNISSEANMSLPMPITDA